MDLTITPADVIAYMRLFIYEARYFLMVAIGVDLGIRLLLGLRTFLFGKAA